MLFDEYKYTNSADSPSFQKLCDLAQEDGVDVELLRDILWQVTAHSQLIALPRAANCLAEMLAYAPLEWNDALKKSGVINWLPVLEWIVKKQIKIGNVIGAHFTKTLNTTGHNPIRGSGMSVFPAYSSLCEPVDQHIHKKQYLLLVGQLVIAYVMGVRSFSSRIDYERNGVDCGWKFLPNDVDRAARAIRRLTEQEYSRYLKSIEANCSPEEFAKVFEAQVISLTEQEKNREFGTVSPDKTVSDIFSSDAQSLIRFIKKCWGQLEWIERAGKGSSAGKGHKWIGGRLEMDQRLTMERRDLGDIDDEFNSWGSVEIISFRSATLNEVRQRLSTDLSPDEDGDDGCLILSAEDCKITKQDAGELARAAHGKARHIAMANQLMPWSYESLSLEEVITLLLAIDEAYRVIGDVNHWATEDWQLAEALLLIQVMLWTGCHAEIAAEVRVCHEDESIGKDAIAIVIPKCGGLDAMRWRIKSIEPDYKTNIDASLDQIRPAAPYFDLPELVGLTPIVNDLCLNRNQVGGQKLFKTLWKPLIETATTWLKSCSPDKRITLRKIEEFIWRQMVTKVGDPVAASCTTGFMHTLSRVRLFYTSLSVNFIIDHYTCIVEQIVRKLPWKIGPVKKNVDMWKSSCFSEAVVGARNCPSVEAVQLLFKNLRADIKQASSFTHRKDFVRYHNLYTLFTVQYFAYATTCRAVSTPFMHVDTIDAERYLVPLSDKDDEFSHKTRLVHIPPMLFQQMWFYHLHIESVKQQLPATAIIGFENESCFFLDENRYCSVKVSPKTIEPLLKPYLNVRANTHRRFLRTELLERGCASEVIDAFMGHWNQGEEPFGVFSSFSFSEYVATLSDYLYPLLNEIGLTKPIRSCLIL